MEKESQKAKKIFWSPADFVHLPTDKVIINL